MPDSTGWISAIAGIAALLIAVATLVTVYVAALQLASLHRNYRQSLTQKTLGPWKKKVDRSKFFGLEKTLYSPQVRLATLIEQN